MALCDLPLSSAGQGIGGPGVEIGFQPHLSRIIASGYGQLTVHHRVVPRPKAVLGVGKHAKGYDAVGNGSLTPAACYNREIGPLPGITGNSPDSITETPHPEPVRK